MWKSKNNIEFNKTLHDENNAYVNRLIAHALEMSFDSWYHTRPNQTQNQIIWDLILLDRRLEMKPYESKLNWERLRANSRIKFIYKILSCMPTYVGRKTQTAKIVETDN